MIKKRIAVIDLGTNAFQLIIAEEKPSGHFATLTTLIEYPRLGAGGVSRINDDAFSRGISTLMHFADICQAHQVAVTKAIGTAIFRTASNGQAFVTEAMRQAGIHIRIIDGLEEARLIARAVMHAVPSRFTQQALIVDIGGGSVECMLVKDNQLSWVDSFPIGMAALKAQFSADDPITVKQQQAVHDLLDKTLRPLAEQLKIHQVSYIIGTSAVFQMISKLQHQPHQPFALLDIRHFNEVFIPLVDQPEAHIAQLACLQRHRPEYVIMETLLLQHFLQLTRGSQLILSSYAVKEGLVLEVLNQP